MCGILLISHSYWPNQTHSQNFRIFVYSENTNTGWCYKTIKTLIVLQVIEHSKFLELETYLVIKLIDTVSFLFQIWHCRSERQSEHIQWQVEVETSFWQLNIDQFWKENQDNSYFSSRKMAAKDYDHLFKLLIIGEYEFQYNFVQSMSHKLKYVLEYPELGLVIWVWPQF